MTAASVDAASSTPLSDSPLVSVVMTVWNGRKYIGESIESILRQTFQPLELIVVDDGSTDDTCAIVEAFKDPRIRLLRREHFGVVSSANFGISQARGIYIARLDADDISKPERIARQVTALGSHKNAVLCFTDSEVFGEDIFGDLSPGHKQARMGSDTAFFRIQMCSRCPFIHSSVMFRKEVFDRIGGYLTNHPAEDFSLYTRLVRVGSFIGIPLKLTRYRRHAESATCRRMEEGAKYSKEIRLDHIKFFLKVDEAQAERLFALWQLPPGQRAWRTWFFFCGRVLRHPSCWRPEPLAYLLLQTLKNALKKSGLKPE